MTSVDRARLVGLNEAVFREVNERLDELAAEAGGRVGAGPLDLICECGDASCASRLRVDPDDYADARSQPRQFLVHPGHVATDVERIVQKRPGYDLIEKLPGLPAEIAEETDPRS
jgi:hypothetical protein